MTSQDPLSLVGTTVSEKYEIERVVGEGGFAVVYRAQHTVWKRPVAIKVFRALGDLPADKRQGLVDSFIQEGRLLADLSERSAAICQARDVGTLRTRDGREMPYMVLEWLEGLSLEQVIETERARGLPPRTAEQALAILEPAAEALALAHRKGIAHRDVKPANIFVLGDPRGDFTVKLLDFGIAKVVQDAQRLGGSFQQTQGHVSSFTPAYGAPEQFSRAQGATGPWTDVFALALIFGELMTNAPPLRGDDLTQLAFAAMDPRRRPTPRVLGAEIPDALENVLLKALAVAPDERFKSCAEMWDAVRGALGLGPSRVGSTTDIARMSGRPSLGEGLAPMSAQGTGSIQVVGGPMAPVTISPHVSTSPRAAAPTMHTARAKSSTGVILGASSLALLLLASAGVWAVKLRNKDATTSVGPASGAAMTSAATSSAAIASPPPKLECPPGMAKIMGGKFFMGSDDKVPKNQDPNKDLERERPAHQVTLPPYCIDLTEVTVAQYKACTNDGNCKRGPEENEWPGIDEKEHKLYDPLCNIREPEAKASFPINCIDWDLANKFCLAVGKRLPTEAEWEFATRGSDGRRYPWGDESPKGPTALLNACGKECVAWGKKHPDPNSELVAMYAIDDGWETTAPVGSFPKGDSPYGLHDVVGNVWEWTADWYAPYEADVVTNPTGPASGTERVLRGGSWNGSDPNWVRPTYRFKAPPDLRSHGTGMRCAKTLEARPPGE